MREVVAECENPVMLYPDRQGFCRDTSSRDEGVLSGEAAFLVLHVDTTWKFQ